MELDPSQFLAQGSSDEEDDGDDESDSEEINNRASNGKKSLTEPPILTSLGLTHVNNVQNPYSSYAVSTFK